MQWDPEIILMHHWNSANIKQWNRSIYFNRTVTYSDKTVTCFNRRVIYSNRTVSPLIFPLFFIKALHHKCWRSVGNQVLQPAKDIDWVHNSLFEKLRTRKKSMMPRQPQSCSRSIYARTLTGVCQAITGNQDIFSLFALFSCIYIHRNLRE